MENYIIVCCVQNTGYKISVEIGEEFKGWISMKLGWSSKRSRGRGGDRPEEDRGSEYMD